MFNRTGILNEGISVFSDTEFSKRMGYTSFTLFWYNLKGLTHAKKVKFNYILAGRNTKGIIEEFSGIRLANGAVRIPIKNSYYFEEILKDNKVNYERKNILEEN